MSAKYSLVTWWQLLVLTALMSVFVSVLVSINSWYQHWTLLPVVLQDASGACVKVDNYANGDAYGCEDIGVLLRQYRKAPIK